MTSACGDEGKYPGDMNEIECNGEGKVNVASNRSNTLLNKVSN